MDMVPEVPEDEAAVAPPPASGPPEDSQVQLAGFLSAIVVTAFHSANPSYESLAKADDLGSLVAVPQALEMLLAKVPIMLVRKNAEWLRAEFAVLRNQQLERQRQVNQLQRSVPAKPAGPGKPSK